MKTKGMIAAFVLMLSVLAAFTTIYQLDEAVASDSDDHETVYLHGEFTSEMILNSNQIAIVDSDLVIKDGGQLTVNGNFIVKEGVTVTIEGKGSSLKIYENATIDGNIVSKTQDGLDITPVSFSTVTINGTVSMMGDTSGTTVQTAVIDGRIEDASPVHIFVNGIVIVGSNAGANLNCVIFNEGSKLYAYGDLSGSIRFAGYACFDASLMLDLYMTDPSAVIDVIEARGPLNVYDTYMYAYSFGGMQYYVGLVPGNASSQSDTAVSYDEDTKTFYSGDDLLRVEFNNLFLADVRNLKVTERVETAIAYDEKTSQDRMYAKTFMTLSALDAEKNVERKAGAIYPTISVNGPSVYVESMTISESSFYAYNGIISGTLVYEVQPELPSERPFFSVEHMKVEGLLWLKGLDLLRRSAEATVDAVMYTERTNDNRIDYYYTTLDKAVSSGAKDILATGQIIVDKDIEIPAGTKVTTSEVDPYSVIIKEGATFKFADQSKLVLNGDVNVEGALIFENIDFGITLGDNAIFADVMKKTDAKVEYMNIYVAFAGAVAGDELEAYLPVNGTIVIDKDLTLPALVEFSNVCTKLEGTPAAISVDNGVVFTIAGALYMDAPINLIAETGNGWNDKTPATDGSEVKDYSVIKIGADGLIVFQDRNLSLTGDDIYEEFKIAGAYYKNNTSTPGDDGELYIANIPLAFAGILDVKDFTVGIYGEVTIDSKVTGTEKDRITIDIDSSAKVTFKDFAFAYGKVRVHTAELTGAIGTATGKMVFSEATVDAVLEDTFVDNAMNLLVMGAVNSIDPASISGIVYFDRFSFTADWTDAPSTATVADKRFNVPAGTALMVIENAKFYDCELLVAGELTVRNTGSLTVTDGQNSSLLSVTGTLTVDKVDGKSGTLDATYIYVGANRDAVTSGTGSINGAGAFDADSLIQLSLFVFKGASVNMDVLKDWMAADTTKNTEFYVDDALWATVFGQGVLAIFAWNMDGETEYYFVPALDNVKFISWQTYDAKNKTYKDIVLDDGEMVWVGMTGYDKVYANLSKDIYRVFVTADVGIDNVYIDGKIMLKYNQYNYFEASVTVGTHTITYELANGYTGNAYITTIDGKAIAGSGLTFKVSDDNYDATKDYMDITISGIQKSGYDTDPETHPEKSTGLTVTEILLIVVVIIMAIMAVVLILRLNRS